MIPLTPRRLLLRLVPLGFLLIVVLAVSPSVGTHPLGLGEAWTALFDESAVTARTIAWDLRFPRALKAVVAGITLALAGAVYQTLFRNPLATPYTLGVASGASLGALIAYRLHWVTTYAGLSSVALSAFLGALAVLALVLGLARSTARVTGQTLLLAGITIGFFCSGMMIFVTSLADMTETHRTVRWMMGSLDTFGGVELTALLPFVLPAWLILLWLARGLNQYSAGTEIAATRGVNVARLEWVGIFGGSLAVAAVVALCGPIGFVGLIIPHLTRLLFGSDHRVLLPASALMGGVFLVLCDFLTAYLPGWYAALTGRATTTARLPIGVMTALIGTPVFLTLLATRRRLRQ